MTHNKASTVGAYTRSRMSKFDCMHSLDSRYYSLQYFYDNTLLLILEKKYFFLNDYNDLN